MTVDIVSMISSKYAKPKVYKNKSTIMFMLTPTLDREALSESSSLPRPDRMLD